MPFHATPPSPCRTQTIVTDTTFANIPYLPQLGFVRPQAFYVSAASRAGLAGSSGIRLPDSLTPRAQLHAAKEHSMPVA
jgi:hypothetical protein